MPVVGQKYYILYESVTFAEVNVFSPDYEMKNIPIVDASVRYDFPHSMITYILVIRNALHVTSTTKNMILPVMMREVGVMVYDTPKIKVDNLTVKDHTIYFQDTGIRIPLQLWGIFS